MRHWSDGASATFATGSACLPACAGRTSKGTASIGWNVAASGSALVKYIQEIWDPGLSWEAVAWLRGLTDLPLVLKGVLTAEDARRTIEYGVSGLLVSNHGGRQLDGAPSGAEALYEIAEAVGDQAEIYVDGGIRRGSDVLKALALGARAVAIGRPYLWGLAVDGENGARGVLEMLRSELDLAMALSGRPRIADIDRASVAWPR